MEKERQMILVDKEELEEFNAQFLELLWQSHDLADLYMREVDPTYKGKSIDEIKEELNKVEQKLNNFCYRFGLD